MSQPEKPSFFGPYVFTPIITAVLVSAIAYAFVPVPVPPPALPIERIELDPDGIVVTVELQDGGLEGEWVKDGPGVKIVLEGKLRVDGKEFELYHYAAVEPNVQMQIETLIGQTKDGGSLKTLSGYPDKVEWIRFEKQIAAFETSPLNYKMSDNSQLEVRFPACP